MHSQNALTNIRTKANFPAYKYQNSPQNGKLLTCVPQKTLEKVILANIF
uniref:Uncharacterized protein n=1 Tax=Rhizophora mucronata TaxID=61149 RepID=A0A2P2QIL0_RHIMU